VLGVSVVLGGRSAFAQEEAAPSGDVEPEQGGAPAEGEGVFGPLRVGPLVGAGVATRPIDLGVMLVVDRVFGVGFDYAFIPRITIGDSSLTASQVGADVRVMPFGGAFFVGASVGYQTLTANVVASGGGYSASSGVRVESPFVTPRFGWLWIWNPGFTFGVDAGAVIPFAFKTTTSGVHDQGFEDTVSVVGKTVFPDLKLRLGFLF
jgi:hypothetical protein